MPAHSARSRRSRLVVPLLAGALTAACIDVQEGTPKQPGTDTAVAAGTAPAADTGLVAVRGKFGGDSATPTRGMGPQEVQLALRTDTASTLSVIDSAPAAMPTGTDLDVLRREMVVPVGGMPASALHDTYDEVRGGTRRHEALDILAPRGTPVLSAASGRVLKLFDSKAGGLMVYAADSTERFILMYGHLDAYQPGLAEGQPLRRGQQIGFVGTTGNAPANVPHLHFAVARSDDVKQWWKGAPVNPYPLLAK
jgi:murein DD-endopeptidase MepM/ murein hydrolase activator NlpD